MRILLTGASGFTGRHFAARAAAAGHTVAELHANLTDSKAVKEALASCGPVEAVVHLAGIAFVGHADNTAFYAVNTVGTTVLLDSLAAQARQGGQMRVLLASSANVYGNAQHSPIRETQPTAPVNHYAASKLAMEHLAQTFTDRLQVVIARPFNYTGPGQSADFLIPKLVDHFARKAPVIELGNLHVEREFNDVRMVCDAYLGLLEKGVAGQVYNVCTGQTHTLQTVLDTLEALTGHRLQVRVNPDFVRPNEVHRLCGDPGRLLECVGEMQSHPLTETLRSMLDTVRAANVDPG